MTDRRTDRERGLSGRGLQQSADQWAQRGALLVQNMSSLAAEYTATPIGAGLDIGCQEGALTDGLADELGGTWHGIDPGIAAPTRSAAGFELVHGWAHELPYPDASFDVCVLANVFEHIAPEQRAASLAEIARVLRPDGVLVGQIPNPYFFVESHSRLPLMGYLPVPVQKRYWRLAPVPWDHDFHVVTMKHLTRAATPAGLERITARNFNYPLEVIPSSVRWVARALAPVSRRLPWAWQFVFRRQP